MPNNQPIQTAPIESGDWQELLGSIALESCVLFVGPGAIVDDGGVPLRERLLSLLKQQLPQGTFGGSRPNPYQLMDRIVRVKGWRKILLDANQQVKDLPAVDNRFEQIAQIPFPLVISTSPHLMLKQAFEDLGVSFTFRYFNDRKPAELGITPSIHHPVLYNLHGSYEDERSLVRTHDDLFEFLFSVVNTRKLPIEIRDTIHQATNFIFLGYDFDDWSLRILLRNFESHLKDRSYAPSWKDYTPSPDIMRYYGDNFKINFVDSNIRSFIDELHAQCLADQRVKIRLTQHLPPAQRVYKLAQEAIKRQEIKAALDLLDQYFIDDNDSTNLNSVYVFLGRYSRLKEKQNLRLLTREETEVAYNKITRDLLDFLEEISS